MLGSNQRGHRNHQPSREWMWVSKSIVVTTSKSSQMGSYRRWLSEPSREWVWVSKLMAVTTSKSSRMGSYRRRWSEPSRMGWVSFYQWRLGLFLSMTLRFLHINDAWLSSHWRQFYFFLLALVVRTVVNGLGFFLSMKLGFLFIGDAWLSFHRRRLAFFSSVMVSFGIGDAWVLIDGLVSFGVGFFWLWFIWESNRVHQKEITQVMGIYSEAFSDELVRRYCFLFITKGIMLLCF